MSFRHIDADGAWKGETKALSLFARAYVIDCKSDDGVFHRVYGWTEEALQNAKKAAL